MTYPSADAPCSSLIATASAAPSPDSITSHLSTSDAWQQFDRLTSGGDRPHLFKQFLPHTFPDSREVDRVVARMREAGRERARLRIYAGDERRDDLSQTALAVQPVPGTPAFEGMQDALGLERFAFIINELQDWSPDLTTAAASLLSGMFDLRGIPPWGLEMILFAGNYAGTPFGVHRGFEHAFLCHLGPANKDFYLWSPESYAQLTGGLEDTPNYDHLLAHGVHVVLEPGDVLYLPALWFHIGAQQSYSSSIAIALYDYPIERWFRSALADALGSLPADGPTLPHARIHLDRNPLREEVDHLLATCVRSRLFSNLDDHWFRMLSNAGFLSKRRDLLGSITLKQDDAVRLIPPYRICCHAGHAPGRSAVYLRARRFTLASEPALEKLVGRLNRGETLSLSDAIRHLEHVFEPDATLGVFEALARTGGLQVVPRGF